jgi:SH3 domain-containing YSC84-like protein 1
MKRHLVLVVFSLAAVLGNLAAASTRKDATERLQNSADVLKEIAAAPDKGIPEEVLKSSKCIVVIPHLVKAGFIVGAKHGRGVAVCRTNGEGWSAPAFINVSGGSWGLQIGAEGVDLVMLVMNDNGLRHLLSSKFEITGEGSAAAGPVGRHASAGTDWKLNSELLTYSRSRGVFAGLTLEGAVVEQDADATVAIYGSDISFRKTLLGEVATPASADPFLRAVSEISHQARAQEAREQAPEDRQQPEDRKQEDQQ